MYNNYNTSVINITLYDYLEVHNLSKSENI